MYDTLYPRRGGILDYYERQMLVLEMVGRATERGGGTHEPRLHAYSFFLQEIRGVPTEYEFYRSFGCWPEARDLLCDLTGLWAHRIVRSVPIGPGLEITDTGATKWTRDNYAYIADKYDEDLEVVADRFALVEDARLKLLASAWLLSLNGEPTGEPTDEEVVTWLGYGYVKFPEDLGWEILQEIREFAHSAGWKRPAPPVALTA